MLDLQNKSTSEDAMRDLAASIRNEDDLAEVQSGQDEVEDDLAVPEPTSPALCPPLSQEELKKALEAGSRELERVQKVRSDLNTQKEEQAQQVQRGSVCAMCVT